jgi:hypothetical protein
MTRSYVHELLPELALVRPPRVHIVERTIELAQPRTHVSLDVHRVEVVCVAHPFLDRRRSVDDRTGRVGHG